MGREYREKEWDEPGPDFGKKIRMPKRPLISKPRPTTPKEPK